MTVPGQRGSASIELAIVALNVLVFTAMIVMAGRMTLAHQTADAAAYSAARSASLARTDDEAEEAAFDAAEAWFVSQGIICSELDVLVDTTGFNVPVGQQATVAVLVQCVASLEDVAIPNSGIPGTVELESFFVSPLDRYRSRI